MSTSLSAATPASGTSSGPGSALGSSTMGKAANLRTAAKAKFVGAVEDEWAMFSDNPKDYTLGPPIGFGASSIVYAATYHPSWPTSSSPSSSSFRASSSPYHTSSSTTTTTSSSSSTTSNTSTAPTPTPCALKVLDLDLLPPHSLTLLRRETQLMSLSKHPNVLRVRGSWVEGHKLYIAMRLMRRGSVADLIKYSGSGSGANGSTKDKNGKGGKTRSGGMEEEVVKCVLRQALEGLNYLHTNGFIHRDVKAANLLIDDDGTVLLGDLGVATSLAEDDSNPKRAQTTSSTSATSAPSAAYGPSSGSGSGSRAGTGTGTGASERTVRPNCSSSKSAGSVPRLVVPATGASSTPRPQGPHRTQSQSQSTRSPSYPTSSYISYSPSPSTSSHPSHPSNPSPPSPLSMHPSPTALPSPKLKKRQSFVGTPCWMAPEVIAGKRYDSKADIWSFGITALELTQGAAPRAGEPMVQALLRTVQDHPPTLDLQNAQHKYSKALKEMIDACLAKDPARRPSAAELLASGLFKAGNVKRKGYLSAVLKDLPPLAQRMDRRPIERAVHPTIDAWDFASTVYSQADEDGVFLMDGDGEQDDGGGLGLGERTVRPEFQRAYSSSSSASSGSSGSSGSGSGSGSGSSSALSGSGTASSSTRSGSTASSAGSVPRTPLSVIVTGPTSRVGGPGSTQQQFQQQYQHQHQRGPLADANHRDVRVQMASGSPPVRGAERGITSSSSHLNIVGDAGNLKVPAQAANGAGAGAGEGGEGKNKPWKRFLKGGRA